ncbi:MAG: hypothetical protein A2901_08905 [Elusimicrobia bacterium RIFCSPLOWO2_01_FULL_54_10]|nr:MAG: hypothetical protein A2901_08905 [Elusimicrobia bacterium RIFCSPLOWO2_01_FULL_54_10]
MHIYTLYWDDSNIEHIARHRVSPQEVEEAFSSKQKCFLKARKGRYLLYAQTLAGRLLIIVFDYPTQHKATYVVTARDMDASEWKFFRKKAGL